MRSLVHDPVVPIVFAVAAESTRPAALSVRAAMVSAALSALLHAPSAPTHSASESLVNRSAWPVMIPVSSAWGSLPGSRGSADGTPMAVATIDEVARGGPRGPHTAGNCAFSGHAETACWELQVGSG